MWRVIDYFLLANRLLRQKILEIQDEETRRCFLEETTKEHIEGDNERLKARQEVLEDHNRRLEDQLSKLQLLIEQVESASRNKYNKQRTVGDREIYAKNGIVCYGSDV